MPRKKKETTEEVADEIVTNNEPEETTEEVATGTKARVYDKNMRLIRTYTEADGKDFVKQAEALAAQPRREGWKVVVQ